MIQTDSLGYIASSPNENYMYQGQPRHSADYGGQGEIVAPCISLFCHLSPDQSYYHDQYGQATEHPVDDEGCRVLGHCARSLLTTIDASVESLSLLKSQVRNAGRK